MKGPRRRGGDAGVDGSSEAPDAHMKGLSGAYGWLTRLWNSSTGSPRVSLPSVFNALGSLFNTAPSRTPRPKRAASRGARGGGGKI